MTRIFSIAMLAFFAMSLTGVSNAQTVIFNFDDGMPVFGSLNGNVDSTSTGPEGATQGSPFASQIFTSNGQIQSTSSADGTLLSIAQGEGGTLSADVSFFSDSPVSGATGTFQLGINTNGSAGGFRTFAAQSIELDQAPVTLTFDIEPNFVGPTGGFAQVIVAGNAGTAGFFAVDSITVTSASELASIPEPSLAFGLVIGSVAMVTRRRRRK